MSCAFSFDYNDVMDFFFPAEDLPKVPPSDTYIESLEVDPYPDGERVRVNLRITPFELRPQVELIVRDAQGDEVSTAHVVEPMSWNLELTIHLRGATQGPFSLEARLYYPGGPAADPVLREFEVLRNQ